jgi:hypothetical protein
MAVVVVIGTYVCAGIWTPEDMAPEHMALERNIATQPGAWDRIESASAQIHVWNPWHAVPRASILSSAAQGAYREQRYDEAVILAIRGMYTAWSFLDDGDGPEQLSLRSSLATSKGVLDDIGVSATSIGSVIAARNLSDDRKAWFAQEIQNLAVKHGVYEVRDPTIRPYATMASPGVVDIIMGPIGMIVLVCAMITSTFIMMRSLES